jgi:hypothetical protein
VFLKVNLLSFRIEVVKKGASYRKSPGAVEAPGLGKQTPCSADKVRRNEAFAVI